MKPALPDVGAPARAVQRYSERAVVQKRIVRRREQTPQKPPQLGLVATITLSWEVLPHAVIAFGLHTELDHRRLLDVEHTSVADLIREPFDRTGPRPRGGQGPRAEPY